MFILMCFCLSSDPEIIVLITFMTRGFKLFIEVWLSSMLYLPLFIFFLQDVDEWNQIFVVRSSKIASVIYVYMINLFFWQNTCALLAFQLLRCTAPLFFLDGKFLLKLLLTGCNLCCSCHDFKKEAWGTNKHYAKDNGKQ